jgi:hypothetical protein
MAGNTKFRVGSRDFRQALDFWHSGHDSHIRSTRGSVIVESPLNQIRGGSRRYVDQRRFAREPGDARVEVVDVHRRSNRLGCGVHLHLRGNEHVETGETFGILTGIDKRSYCSFGGRSVLKSATIAETIVSCSPGRRCLPRWIMSGIIAPSATFSPIGIPYAATDAPPTTIARRIRMRAPAVSISLKARSTFDGGDVRLMIPPHLFRWARVVEFHRGGPFVKKFVR